MCSYCTMYYCGCCAADKSSFVPIMWLHALLSIVRTCLNTRSFRAIPKIYYSFSQSLRGVAFFVSLLWLTRRPVIVKHFLCCFQSHFDYCTVIIHRISVEENMYMHIVRKISRRSQFNGVSTLRTRKKAMRTNALKYSNKMPPNKWPTCDYCANTHKQRRRIQLV